jgi:hypothetical protein
MSGSSAIAAARESARNANGRIGIFRVRQKSWLKPRDCGESLQPSSRMGRSPESERPLHSLPCSPLRRKPQPLPQMPQIAARSDAGAQMIAVNLLRPQSLASKEKCKPDNEQQRILCKTSLISRTISKFDALESCSENVTSEAVLTKLAWFDVASRISVMRELRQVKSRQPKAFRPNPESAPEYILTFVVETLECGHKLEFTFLDEAEPLTAKRRVCPQCSTGSSSLPSIPKKPVQSVGGDTADKITTRLHNLLARADAEMNPDKRAAMLNVARELSRKLRSRQFGESVWWSIAFAAICIAIFFGIAAKHQPTGYTFSAPDQYIRVLEKLDDFSFVLQRVDKGVPQPAMVMHFCQDYQPLFETGMTLSWLSYDDRGQCISIAPTDRGYVIVRGPDHRPIISQF